MEINSSWYWPYGLRKGDMSQDDSQGQQAKWTVLQTRTHARWACNGHPRCPSRLNAVQSMIISKSTIQWFPNDLLSALLSSAVSITPWHIPPPLFSKPLDHSWKPWLDLASLPAQFIEIPTDLPLLLLAVPHLHPLRLHIEPNACLLHSTPTSPLLAAFGIPGAILYF